MRGAALVLRWGAVGAAVLATAGAFGYVAGWFSPTRLTPDRFMDAFDQANGTHPGFRRNHAKGVCVSGWFESNGSAALLSNAEILQPGRFPLVGRFALAGGMPMQTDTPSAVRSLALSVAAPDGVQWRTGMNDIPVFAVNSAEAFYELLLASRPVRSTGRPDPNAMHVFLARHPESARALRLIEARAATSGFADATYNGLDAFRLVDAGGRSTPVRWAAVPVQPVEAQVPEQRPDRDRNYLFDDLIAELHRHPLQWRLMITVGQAEDPTSDATLPWPAERARIDAGTVIVDSISSEDGGSCTDINFDPMVLPPGMAPSDDPLLSARSATYARSFTLRARERREKPPSAVTTEAVRIGMSR